MQVIATFDIGTTAVKAVLVGMNGVALDSASQDVSTIFEGERKEQNPRVWWEAFCALSRRLLQNRAASDIAGIVMSGQMQDVIPVGESLQPLCNAILYSDGRGAAQAQGLIDALGQDTLTRITGNAMNGTLSLPKILWLREHMPEVYDRARCFLISSKDYVNAHLTGVCAGDVTACSTVGAMDLQTKVWSEPILAACGLDVCKLPRLFTSHEQIGKVTATAATETGYAEGTPVYAGVGDAGATTLASGIARVGQYNVNLGTSGWVATISESALQNGTGVFNLAAMPTGKVINVVPFLNAGNVHHWVTALFSDTPDGLDYEAMNTLLATSEPGSHGVMALPYLVGERFPVPDTEVKGTYLGITPETGKADLARAMLEGVAYSIRQGLENIGTPPESLSVIGGGGRVEIWCQLLADILGLRVQVYRDADTLPARAIAAAALIAQGILKDYEAFTSGLQKEGNMIAYQPNAGRSAHYEKLYRKYLTLYPLLRAWYQA